MIKSVLTEEMIEEAAQQALNNYGAPTVIMMNGTSFMPYGNDENLPYTLCRVQDYQMTHFFNDQVEAQGFETMIDAASAFHNIGFDPKPFKE